MSTSNNKKTDITALGFIPKLLPILLAVVLWSVLTFQDGQILRKTENLSLFLSDYQFLNECLSIPGGFTGWAGAFLTQFLYLPWLGSLIWIMLLLFSARLTVKAFSIPDRMTALAYIPAVAIITLNVSLGYGIFLMRGQDYFFSTVLGYISALVPLLLEKNMTSSWKILLFRFVWITAGFMLFGSYALAGALASLISGIRNRNAVVSCITAALIIITPLVLYNLYTSYRLADTLYLGLPQVSVKDWNSRIYTPLFIVLAYLPLMALAPFIRADKLKWSHNGILFNTTCYLLFAATVYLMHYGELTFRTEVAMSNAIDDLEWQKAVDIFNDAAKSRSKADARAYESRTAELKGVSNQEQREEIIEKYSGRFYEPTRLMVLYRDLAMVKMDKALDYAFTMKDGAYKPVSTTLVPIVIQAGKQLYLHYGLENMCYRWCFEDIVALGMSVNSLKYLAMQSVATGQWALAAKYLDQLDKTMFHRKWADSQRALLSNPEKVSSTAPYDHIRKLMCIDEKMSADLSKAELYLLSNFTSKRPLNATPEYDKVALFWAMRSLNDQQFWKWLSYYTKSNHVKTLPIHVQEAALFYNSMQKMTDNLPIDSKVSESFNSFMKYADTHMIRSVKESKYPYEQRFGRTFYFFYYFSRDIASY